jgi:hypothetical protein
MEIKYYFSFCSGIGQVFVIHSVKENTNDFFIEKFFIFKGNDQNIISKSISYSYPKLPNLILQQFINNEVVNSQDTILHELIFPTYNQLLLQRNFEVSINLHDTDSSLLYRLNKLVPEKLEIIKNKTSNSLLKTLISLFQSLKIQLDESEF